MTQYIGPVQFETPRGPEVKVEFQLDDDESRDDFLAVEIAKHDDGEGQGIYHLPRAKAVELRDALTTWLGE